MTEGPFQKEKQTKSPEEKRCPCDEAFCMWRAQRDCKKSLDTLALVVLRKFVKCLISRLEAFEHSSKGVTENEVMHSHYGILPYQS